MFRKFLHYIFKYKKNMGLVLLVVVGITTIDLILPFFSRQILNVYIPESNSEAIIRGGFIFVGLVVIYTGLNFSQAYFGHIWGLRLHQDMRERAFKKLQILPFEYFDKNKVGIILSRVTNDLFTISEMIHHGIEDFLTFFLVSIVGFVLLLQINIPITLMIFAFVAIQLIATAMARKHMENIFRKAREKTSSVYAKLESSISAVRLTRAFANEDRELEDFRSGAKLQEKMAKKTNFALAMFSAVNNFFSLLLNIVILTISGTAVIKGVINYGDLLAYIVYFNLLMAPMKLIIRSFETIQEGWVSFVRFQELIDEPEPIKNAPDAVMLKNVKGNINFKNVTFKYEAGTETILKHFNLNIPAGKMVALVGPSGVGKTTIAQIIPRFYEIESGNVYIDDTDIRQADLQSLRENIGYVQQDVVIFWGTIRDNIEYGKLGASDIEVITAAKHAGIHEFIMSLPEGYDTFVGERGVKLSGGQKQRISLARIFLKNPKILILDEATSALDNITEAIIQENIEKLTKNRTVIVVAHRLSTIKQADQIIVLDKDGIVESGTHSELIRNENGHYFKLYNTQLNGFITG